MGMTDRIEVGTDGNLYTLSVSNGREYSSNDRLYTKADMVAMLTEIQLEIEEVPKYCMTHDSICVYRKAEEYISDINNVIQQKINALKADSEVEDADSN